MNVEQIVFPMGVFVVVMWALLKIIVRQFEQRLNDRFSAQEQSRDSARLEWNARFAELEVMARRADSDIQTMKISLPTLYVQREDWIRLSGVIERKMDVIDILKAQVELILLITRKNGGIKHEP